MRAAVLRNPGEAPRVGDFEDPSAAPGRRVLDVELAGLNPVDLLSAEGALGQPPDTPCVVCREGVGRTERGERVYFERPVAPFGAAAERTLVDAGSLVPLPDGADPATAIALGTAGIAAWLALADTAALLPGEHVVVLGSGGAVGQVAVQAARIMGAARIAAVTREPAGLGLELGADVELALADVERLGGGEWDVVVDMMWGAPAMAALAALGPGGRLVQVGSSAARTAELPATAIRGRLLSLIGHGNPAYPGAHRRRAFERMLELARSGELRVLTERLPLDEVASAWERQREGPGRKLVLAP